MMCPYCGEEVAESAESCWKCGTEIDVPDEEERILTPDDVVLRGEDEPRRRRGGPMMECPHCKAIVKAAALRCNSCGKQLKRAGWGLAWVRAAYAAFGVVLLAVIAVPVYNKFQAAPERPDWGRDRPLDVKYGQLDRIYLRQGVPNVERKRAETWRTEHEGKFVVWEGAILNVVDPERGLLELARSSTTGADDPEVRLTLKHPEDIDELNLIRGKRIRYSGRLQEYRTDAGYLVLDLGLVEDQ